ncbi:MAG: fimbrillin family protein [Paraprevotella sp.]|nr:fimbrillin family protein [Paraprevotella sp.]
MKKSYLFAALLAMGALSSCSNGTENVVPEQSQNVEGRQPILLGVGNPNPVAVTRGTGTVGDVGEELSVWNGEELYMLMVKKTDTSDLDYAKESGEYIFGNEAMNAPVGVNAGYMTLKPGVVTKYYPISGFFDFFAYHVDDAKAGEIDETDTQKWMLPFVIDGSQDLMVGKAELTEEQKELMAAHGLSEEESYGAKSARHGIVPSITFKHLLTRLNFTVKAGDPEARGNGVAENAVRVASIDIESKTTGKMVVAYKGTVAEENLIEWANEDKSRLTLKSRVGATLADLVDMEEVNLFDATEEGISAGEALLVAPEEEYMMNVVLKQMAVGADTETTLTFKVPVKTTSGRGFQAGHSYNVSVTLYGMRRIDVHAVLTAWEKGEDISVFPEDEGVN